MKEFERLKTSKYYDEKFKVIANPETGDVEFRIMDGDELWNYFTLDRLDAHRLGHLLTTYDRRPGEID